MELVDQAMSVMPHKFPVISVPVGATLRYVSAKHASPWIYPVASATLAEETPRRVVSQLVSLDGEAARTVVADYTQAALAYVASHPGVTLSTLAQRLTTCSAAELRVLLTAAERVGRVRHVTVGRQRPGWNSLAAPVGVYTDTASTPRAPAWLGSDTEEVTHYFPTALSV
jgi:hypothetical protein